MIIRDSERIRATAVWLLALAASLISQTNCTSSFSRGTLATSLGDDAFWRLSTDLSEPAGVFDLSDNLVSNETQSALTLGRLRAAGGVYIGVGPEQNFSYMAALRPEMAFIVDIRRENQNLHLMYKALFELSADRADFVSRLFSRERPVGLGTGTSVQDLFTEYQAAKPSAALFEANARLIRERLLEVHKLSLLPDDLAGIERIFRAFYSDGPGIHYRRPGESNSRDPSYVFLMTAKDLGGQYRSYLATEESFAFVKDLHTRNLIVPLVGDFAGPTALRRVGDYIHNHASIVSAFYASNVEVYLSRLQTTAFCGNLAALPYRSRSTFIAAKGMRPFHSKLMTCGAR